MTFNFQRLQGKKKLPILSLVIIFIGILYRFYYQFIDWTYNRDAVLLGSDILNHGFPDLITPFESFQSAPPLFLILQKLISNIGPHYISLKIISFLSSVISIIVFKKIIEKSKISIFSICLLLIFTFNPFILYHSLTLKQYTLDLSLSLIAIYYFPNQKSFFKTYIFFMLWCLISNVGLFFSAAYAFNILIRNVETLKRTNIIAIISSNFKNALPFILAPLIYIIYFLWFINQSGADQAKEYMVNYWEAWFVPLDKNIIWWIAVQFFRIMYFFYSTYLVVGIVMLVGFIFSFSLIFRKTTTYKNIYFLKIYGITICVHLFLSSLQLYPFSDRLYLYIAPFVLYLGFYGMIDFLKFLKFKIKQIKIIIVLFTLVLLGLNMSYINYKENDIRALNEKLEAFSDHQIYRTSRANKFINQWVKFTKYSNLNKGLIVSENHTDLSCLKPSDIVISRVHKKFGHSLRTNKIEDTLQVLLANRKTKKIIAVDGYNVYLFLN